MAGPRRIGAEGGLGRFFAAWLGRVAWTSPATLPGWDSSPEARAGGGDDADEFLQSCVVTRSSAGSIASPPMLGDRRFRLADDLA